MANSGVLGRGTSHSISIANNQGDLINSTSIKLMNPDFPMFIEAINKYGYEF